LYKKLINYSTIAIAAVFGISGCGGISPNICSAKSAQAGYYCYQGHNFGKDRSAQYKEGVRDGCHTANGRFHKNYSLSKSSIDYAQGWDAGRATCKLIVPEDARPHIMRTQYQQDIDKRNYHG